MKTILSSLGRLQLVHYTPIPVKEILSGEEMARRKLVSPPANQAPYSFISFLFDSAPLDLFAGKYGADHPWAPGRVMYENAVLLRDMDSDVEFEVLETPSLVKLADEKWGKIPDDQFRKLELQIHAKEGTKGKGLSDLYTQCAKWKGSTRKFYEALFKRPDFEDLKDYYAVTVPHVAIYDRRGAIKVTSSKKVTIPGKPLRSSGQESFDHTTWRSARSSV